MFFHPRMVGNCGGQLVFRSVMDFIRFYVCLLSAAVEVSVVAAVVR